MHAAREMFRSFELPFDEGLVDDELRLLIPDPALFPEFDLAAHRLEVALHAVHADRYRIDEAEVFRVFREDGAEIPLERHVVADKDTIADRHREAHRLVVRVPDADRETAPFEGGFEVE